MVRVAIIVLIGLARTVHAEAPPPAHLAAWDAAWVAYLECLIGVPQFDDGDSTANELARASHPSCEPLARKARAIVREADSDPGYHLAWFRIGQALDRPGAHWKVRDADDVLHDLAHRPRTPRSVAVRDEVALVTMPDTKGRFEVATKTREHAVMVTIDRGESDGGRTEVRIAPNDVVGDWRAISTEDGIIAVNEDEDRIVVARKPPAQLIWAISQVGTGNMRAVVALRAEDPSERGEVSVIRSRDRGRNWDPPVPLGTNLSPQARPNGTVDMWGGTRGLTTWQVVDPSGQVSEKRTFTGDVRTSCVSGKVLWWIDADDRAHVFDGKQNRDLKITAHYGIIVCSATSAIFERNDKSTIRCDREHCDARVSFEGRHPYVDLDDHDRPVIALAAGRTVIVARGSVHRLLRVDAGLVGLVVWNDVPHLLVQDDASGISVVRVPL